VVDSSPHIVKKVTVADGISLEVLDWGGRGQPLILLAGNYNTAHVFDEFAPHLTAKYHVYGITRRGFGISSAPPPTEDNYNSDRLGDDVLAVIDALKIDHPVLAGHSIAGAELSSIGTRHPEKVSGLIYLEAGYDWAFYEASSPTSFDADTNILARDLSQLQATEPSRKQSLIKEIQETLSKVEKGLQWASKEAAADPDWVYIPSPQARIGEAIAADTLKYSGVKSLFAAIYASPHQCQPKCEVNPDSYEAAFPSQIAAVEADYPNARIVRLPYANHYVFRSNQADVLREIDAFIDSLPRR
jgi:pimeloyl-ACP methyl ester carboxylesterase